MPTNRPRALSRLLVALATLAPLTPAIPCAMAQAPARDDVEVGVWLNDIHTIDLVDGSFGVEFYLWWVSHDESFQPFEVLQVLNGRDWVARAVNRRVLADGLVHTSGYVSATISHDWDLADYPFDRQHLRLVLETPFTADELRLVPNHEASIVSEFARAEGFRITGFRLRECVEQYGTDFGFRDDAGTRFSRIVVELDLERRSRRMLVVTLVGFLVANLIALLTYTVHGSLLATRASMCAAAIFGAVGNMYSLQRAVQPAAGSLLVDRIAVVTFGGILVALVTGIVVDGLHRRSLDRAARIVNWGSFGVVLLTSVLYIGRALHEAST